MAIVLGLDISSSHVGFCVYDDAINKILKIENILLNKLVPSKDLFKKIEIFEKVITKVVDSYKIDKTTIEKPVSRFMPGKSSADTIIKLQNFNILCQYILYKLNVKYNLIARATLLKAVTGIGRKPSYIKTDSKEWLVTYFVKEQPDIELKKKSAGKNKGDIHPEAFDIVDAWACCKY
jgi:Holliday junction resolvasome RuvABC endonuclease subunit